MSAPDFTLSAEGASSLQRMVSKRPLNRSGATECKESSGLVGVGGDSKTQPERQTLNELALFAGAGGGILGGKLLGWRTVCAVEYDEHARRVFCARQDDGWLEPFQIWDDVRTFDGKPWHGIVDVVSGGFPCQDISVANSSADGLEGERSGLWREMARIVCEVRPAFVLVENSPALTFRGLGNILGDLAAMGYDARWGVFSAADVGAQHLRERLWIVAYSDEMGGKICLEQKPWRPLPRHRVDFLEHTHNLQPEPRCYEAMMGWPIGWTGLRDAETVKFPEWCASHGTSLRAAGVRSRQATETVNQRAPLRGMAGNSPTPPHPAALPKQNHELLLHTSRRD